MDATDLKVAELIRGRRAIRRRYFRPLDCTIGIRMLTDDEIDGAKLAAQQYAKERRADLDLDPEFLEREKVRQVIWRAIVDPDSEDDPPRAFFASYREVRQLDAALVNALWNAWSDTQEELAPAVALKEGEIDELVEALSKGQGREEVLTLFAPVTLRALVRSMADRLASSTTGRSSTT